MSQITCQLCSRHNFVSGSTVNIVNPQYVTQPMLKSLSHGNCNTDGSYNRFYNVNANDKNHTGINVIIGSYDQGMLDLSATPSFI